jgi:hypothetical protein
LRDEIERVVDHLPQFRIGNSGLELDRVPMFLVHVIAGPHLLVAVA